MMNKKKRDKCSKFMSLILRHKPQEFGVVLDEEGYCPIDDLLMVFQSDDYWKEATKEDVLQIIGECPKQRYEMKGKMVRARYGHSAQKIDYEMSKPPAFLFHGTYEGAVDSIFREGLKKMNRKYVHLSETTHFASLAGKRRGSFVLLKVDCSMAYLLGVNFYYAGNEVWLSDDIPDSCIERVEV